MCRLAIEIKVREIETRDEGEGLAGKAGEFRILHLPDEPRHVVWIAGDRDAVNQRAGMRGVLRERSQHRSRTLWGRHFQDQSHRG